jgi:hypothetical protein
LWYPVVVPKRNVCSPNLTLYQQDIRYGIICTGIPSSETGGTYETPTISVGLVTDSGCEVRVKNNKMLVDIDGPLVIAKCQGNGLYVCNIGVDSAPIALVSTAWAKSL